MTMIDDDMRLHFDEVAVYSEKVKDMASYNKFD